VLVTAAFDETAATVDVFVALMEMPELKPVEAPGTRTRRLVLVCVAAFIVIAFAFAFWINMPEWR
jgi:hypothetical protein